MNFLFMCKGYWEVAAVLFIFGFTLEPPGGASVVLGLMKTFPMKRVLFLCHSKNNHLNTWHNKCLIDILCYESFFFLLL